MCNKKCAINHIIADLVQQSDMEDHTMGRPLHRSVGQSFGLMEDRPLEPLAGHLHADSTVRKGKILILKKI